MTITRDVVTDLWPLYVSGEASPASRELVEAFLKQDPEFARQLHASSDGDLKPTAVPLPPDLEARSFARTRKVLQGRSRLRQMAVLCTGLALAFCMMDAPWDVVSPHRCIATAVIAVGFWIAYAISVRRLKSAVV